MTQDEIKAQWLDLNERRNKLYDDYKAAEQKWHKANAEVMALRNRCNHSRANPHELYCPDCGDVVP